MSIFTGYLDGIFDGELLGWAIDVDNREVPVVLAVFIDDWEFTRTLACEHRMDVAGAVASSGLHGFRVRLPEFASAHQISVRLPDGEVLGSVSSPRLSPGPCLLFMHIQKTAGTAFRDAALANYRRSEVALVYPDPPGIPVLSFPLFPEQQRRTFKCIFGHFKFGIHGHMPHACEYVTMVRDPIERAFSNYRHMCFNRSEKVIAPDGARMSLQTVIAAGEALELDNLMTRYFRGGEEYHPFGSIGQDAYEQALAHMLEFRYIGHQERSDLAWAQLSQLYGWRQGAMRRVNIGSDSSSEIGPAARAILSACNKYDLLLYSEICKRWGSLESF